MHYRMRVQARLPTPHRKTTGKESRNFDFFRILIKFGTNKFVTGLHVPSDFNICPLLGVLCRFMADHIFVGVTDVKQHCMSDSGNKKCSQICLTG